MAREMQDLKAADQAEAHHKGLIALVTTHCWCYAMWDALVHCALFSCMIPFLSAKPGMF